MSFSWSKHARLDSTGLRKTAFTSAFKNVRYRLDYWKTITVTQADVANLPGISFRMYGTVSAFHLILAYNGLTDPLTDIFPGQKLQLFTLASLTALVSESRKNPPRTIRI